MSQAPALRVVEANARAYRRVWKASIVTTVVNPILFLTAMGLGLGTLVDKDSGVPLGITYIAFIAPGLLAAAAMQTGSSEASWPVFDGIKWRKTFHATLATPVGVADLLNGILGWATIRLLMSTSIFVAVMAIFDAVPLADGINAIPPAILTGLAFAVPSFAFTTWIKTELHLVSLYRFGIMPMFLFSGTFFPVEQLPNWLEPIALATPLWHGVELCRSAALGIEPALPTAIHVGYLLLWTVIPWWAARDGLRRKLQP